ncbi:HVA22-like protein k [Quercus suber]|uniref:HVA22-like protein n=1 Tax=Quercus suber TaxID=58331 RepID=A0AAW0K814_QUESU|nr:HVA22-like protein k [Quercus suber]POE61741.1 hva22-like protein k [Quercus suber]
MALPTQVGLGLLLCPLGSNIIVRTASCSIGIALPVYKTFKAIEEKDQDEQQRWLLYWAAYGSFSLAEVFADKLLSWFPLYYHVKFAFLVWLQLPSANGAKDLYMSHLRPFLLKHQAILDQIVDFIYSQLSKFVSTHQAKIQFAKTISLEILTSAYQFVRGTMHPMQKQPNPNAAIEGPPRRIEELESDKED